MDWPIPLWRQGGRKGSASTRKGHSWPQRRHLHQTASRLLVANQDFLGFWMVDIHQESCSQRSAPQKRHATHLRWACPLPPRKPSGWDRGGDKMHPPPGETALPKHLVTWAARTWEGHKTQVQASLRLCGESENLRGLDLGSARNPGPASDSSSHCSCLSRQCSAQAEQPGAWEV